MSICSVSEVRARRLLPLAALLVLLTAGPAAAARTTIRGGDVIRVNQGGITIVHEDSTRDSIAEGERHRFKVKHDVLDKGLTIDMADDGEGVVRMFSDAVVPAGERVTGDVVTLFGSADVEGEVTGSVVAVFGSVRLQPGATVDGDVVTVGGGVEQADGTNVGGQVVSIGLFPFNLGMWGMPGLPVMLGCIVVGWLTSLLVGWIFTLLFPQRLVRVAATASRRTAASFFLGLLSFPGSLLAIVLLVVTVIGVPIALLFPLVFGIMVYAGQLAATYVLGCKLVRRPLASGSGLLLPMVAGLTFVGAFFAIGAVLGTSPGVVRIASLFFGLLGILLVFGLSCIGAGAFLLSGFGRDPRDVVWPSATAPSAPAPFPGSPSPAAGV
jgi:cytoskeletal protein CcmA (bactofilin family)